MEIQNTFVKSLMAQQKNIAPKALERKAHMVILASLSNEKIDRWQKGLQDYAQILGVANFTALRDRMKEIKPDILLLDHDLPELAGAKGIVVLRKLSPDTKIVMLSGPTSDDEEWAFFRAGVRGCCRNDIDPAALKTLVMAVQQGELWIRRTLTYRLLDQFGETDKRNENDRSCLGLLPSLTRREYEISMQVRNGGSNKQIAQSLEITERTVKAHLTGVYRKLGVVDRLKLAIVLSGDKRQARRESHGPKVVNAA